jgi:hypothetical protein
LCAQDFGSPACGSIAFPIVEDSAQIRIGERLYCGKTGLVESGIKGGSRFIPAPGLNRGGLSRRAKAPLDL